MKPKLILDTNVCDKVLNPDHGYDTDRIRKKMNGEFDVYISPQTFTELLNAILGGESEKHFRWDKERIRLVAGNAKPHFLELPGAFALSKILGIQTSVSQFTPARYNQCFRVVLAAKRRSDLVEGRVKLSNSIRSFGINLAMVADMQKEGVASHHEWLTAVKAKNHSFPERSKWQQ
ncbi:MAG: hypothetical protein M3O35_06590 [Acidobacteriota bacterium]|nr:hypothetical protein [Acidobacteriota bacterium]